MKDDLCERPQSLITHAYCHLCGKILLVLKGVNIKKLGQLIIVQKSTAVLPDCKCFCIFENLKRQTQRSAYLTRFFTWDLLITTLIF
jgi:hypothetical protein